jgi:hypothetical protein
LDRDRRLECPRVDVQRRVWMADDKPRRKSANRQAGVVPVTWQQVMLEWQRDWARRDTYDAVMSIVREHSGAYGMGVDYAYTMVHRAAQRTSKVHEALAPVVA